MEKEKDFDSFIEKYKIVPQIELKEYDVLLSIYEKSKNLDYGCAIPDECTKAMGSIQRMIGHRILSRYFNLED